jgi:four helix bundle protein
MRKGDTDIMKTTSDEGARKSKVTRHTDLEVYQRAFAAAMEVFRLSKTFPAEEKYSLTDQGRRSSRSVAANISEAWRKRRYSASFVSKLNDAEGEAAETQTWPQFAVECVYANAENTRAIYSEYDSIIGMLVNMQNHPEQWCLTKR